MLDIGRRGNLQRNENVWQKGHGKKKTVLIKKF